MDDHADDVTLPGCVPLTAILAPALVTAGDKDLDNKNASVAVVGKDHPFTIIEGEALQKYLDAIEVSPMQNVEIVPRRSRSIWCQTLTCPRSSRSCLSSCAG
jgi:hypothetical protein